MRSGYTRQIMSSTEMYGHYPMLNGLMIGGSATFESDVYVLNNIVNRCEE